MWVDFLIYFLQVGGGGCQMQLTGQLWKEPLVYSVMTILFCQMIHIEIYEAFLTGKAQAIYKLYCRRETETDDKLTVLCSSLMMTLRLFPCNTTWACDISSSGTTEAGTRGREPTMTPPRPLDWARITLLPLYLEAPVDEVVLLVVEAAVVVLLAGVRRLEVHFLGRIESVISVKFSDNVRGHYHFY